MTLADVKVACRARPKATPGSCAANLRAVHPGT
jgi:hypothetical protein